MRGRAGQAFVVAPRASAEGDEGRKATGRAWASFQCPGEPPEVLCLTYWVDLG